MNANRILMFWMYYIISIFVVVCLAFILKKGNYSEPALLKDEIRVTCDRIFDCFVSIVSLFMCRAYVGHDF